VKHPALTTLLVALVTAGATSVPAASLLLGAEPAETVRTTPSVSLDPSRSQPCGDEPADADGWSDLWGSASGSWAGGDGASSTRLPDGRILWVFGDTFTGTVDAEGVRGPDAGMVRNSLVVTDGTCWTSASPGRAALPGRDGTWLWPTHSLVQRADDPAVVSVFAQRLATDRTDALGFRRVGAAVVTVTVPAHGRPVVGAVTDLPESDVLWGAAVVVRGGTAWIYGTRPHPGAFGRDLLLARAPVARVSDVATWSYRTATGWSRRAGSAAVVLPTGVSTVLAARTHGAGTMLVTKPEEFLDEHVVALTSANPWGPWRSRILFTAPSGADEFAYAPGLVAVRPGRHDVVVISRTSMSLETLMRDATASMPEFRDIGTATP
jgi:hypothetical protein